MADSVLTTVSAQTESAILGAVVVYGWRVEIESRGDGRPRVESALAVSVELYYREPTGGRGDRIAVPWAIRPCLIYLADYLRTASRGYVDGLLIDAALAD